MALFRIAFLAGVAALLATSRAEEPHDHDHGDEVSCGCAAKDFDFQIDCESSTMVSNAIKALAGCTSAKCTFTEHDDHAHDEHEEEEEACIKNWLILQSHHDHCLPTVLSEDEKNKFHE